MSRPRRLGLVCWLLALLAVGTCPAVADDGIAVIVAPEHPLLSLDRRGLAAIFKRKQRVTAAGAALVPVNLPASAALRIAFSRAVFAQDPAGLDTYWNERYFHGIAPPHVVNSIEAMLRFVAATPGAIGYVPACRVDARVRVLLLIPAALDDCRPAR
ncbi:MAG TPA: hypothetical protein PJ986_01650 [Gammaproteobacteria bacterium]|nr:hypothetical protein [Gammaproteobacteria bacterium]